MSRTTIEKIDSIKTQIQQLENERKRLLNQQKEAERKARTKRLIERGAILESLIIGGDKFTNEQIKTFLEKTVQSESARKILDGFIAQKDETTMTKVSWETKNSGISTTGKATATEQGSG